MMQPTGTSKHGQFVLANGCPQCLAEKRAAQEETPAVSGPFLIKVQYVITVPVRNRTATGRVTAIDVPEAEVEGFKDYVKVIPSGSILESSTYPSTPAVPPAQQEMAEGLASEGYRIAENPETPEGPVSETTPIAPADVRSRKPLP